MTSNNNEINRRALTGVSSFYGRTPCPLKKKRVHQMLKALRAHPQEFNIDRELEKRAMPFKYLKRTRFRVILF